MKLRSVLVEAVRVGASDIRVTSGEGPRFRIEGEIQAPLEMIITVADITELLEKCCGNESEASVMSVREFDAALEIPEVGRFRVHAFHHLSGVAVVIRVIPAMVPSMADLELPLVVRNVGHLRHGLVMLAGATGSGKSTTMASIIDQLNREREIGRAHV